MDLDNIQNCGCTFDDRESPGSIGKSPDNKTAQCRNDKILRFLRTQEADLRT